MERIIIRELKRGRGILKKNLGDYYIGFGGWYSGVDVEDLLLIENFVYVRLGWENLG